MSETHSQTNFFNRGFQADDSHETERLAAHIVEELHKIAKSDAKKNPAAWQGLDLHDVIAEIFLRFKAAGKEKEDAANAAEPRKQWNGRKHFYCAAAVAIRNLRIDYARRRKAMHLDSKISLKDSHQAPPCDDVVHAEQLIRLNAALERLAEVDPEAAQVIELRFFGVRPLGEESGTSSDLPSSPQSHLSYEQIAELIGKSKGTVRLWDLRGQKWLSDQLGGANAEDRS